MVSYGELINIGLNYYKKKPQKKCTLKYMNIESMKFVRLMLYGRHLNLLYQMFERALQSLECSRLPTCYSQTDISSAIQLKFQSVNVAVLKQKIYTYIL